MYIWLTDNQTQQIGQHALEESPREACGIIGGIANQAYTVIPVPNVASNPLTEYRLDDRVLASTLYELNQKGWSIIGFYHSHPAGDPVPSPVDIHQATYPHTPYLIVGLRDGNPRLAAWQMAYGEVQPIEVYIGIKPPQAEDNLSSAQKITIITSALIAFIFMLVLSLSLLPPAPPIP